MTGEQSEGSGYLKIVHGRVDSLSLYEITDYELQVLENGSFGATYLNFSIFFLSMAVAFLIALNSGATIPDRTFTVFVVFVVIGLAAGAVMVVLWFKTRKSMSTVLKRIKDRCNVADPAADLELPVPLEASEESAGRPTSASTRQTAAGSGTLGAEHTGCGLRVMRPTLGGPQGTLVWHNALPVIATVISRAAD